MQFGLAEIIGSAGVALATGVGIIQIWLAYIQLQKTKKIISQELSENETGDKSTQDALIRRPISHQLRGNLYEAKLLIEKAKAIPVDNSQLLTLEQQLNTEIKKPYVSNVSGKVIERRLFEDREHLRYSEYKSKHSRHKYSEKQSYNYSNEPMGCISTPVITFAAIIYRLVEAVYYLFSRSFSFLVIFVFTGLIYLLLKWFNF